MITDAELRAQIRLPPDQDDELQLLRAEVVALWERETGFLWDRRVDYVQLFTVANETHVRLPLELRPVEAVALVEQRGAGDAAWVAMGTSEWLLDSDCVESLVGPFQRRVRVKYTGGHVARIPTPPPTPAQTVTPGDVRRALLLQAAFIRARTGQEKIAIKSQAVERSGSTVYEDADCHPYFERLAKLRCRKF